MKKIIIVGGGAAGAKTASKAKRLNPNNQIELFTDEDKIAFSLCGLPYYIEDSIKDINSLIIKTPDDFKKMGISVFLNHTLTQIFPEKNCVLINNNHIFYDELILALGAKVNIPKVKNVDLNNIFTLRTLDSAVKIKEKMRQSKSVVIVGGGYISIELAQSFIKNDLKVTIIEANSTLLSIFDDEFSKIIADVMKQKAPDKIELALNERISEFKDDGYGNFKSVITQSGKEFCADFCIISTGIKPNSDIAARAGIKIGTTGAIYVDNKMRTNVGNIYAAGDCAQKYCITTKKPIYVGLGAIANKEGRVAAINATGESYETFDGILASAITGFFDFTISKTGLSEKRAFELSKEINLEPVSITITKKDKAGYMPNSRNMTIKITADKRSGELLGAQGIGCGASVAQRINTITSLLNTRSSVNDLIDLDLAYAPPYSGSIDPILTAAYKLKELLKK